MTACAHLACQVPGLRLLLPGMQLKLIFSLLIPAVLICADAARAQRPVALRDSVPQYIFPFQEIEYLEDPGRALTIEDVSKGELSKKFTPSPTFSPVFRLPAIWRTGLPLILRPEN